MYKALDLIPITGKNKQTKSQSSLDLLGAELRIYILISTSDELYPLRFKNHHKELIFFLFQVTKYVQTLAPWTEM
jgi:hypothetical protein